MRRVLTGSLGILALLAFRSVASAAPGKFGLDNHVGPPQAHSHLGNYGTPTVSWLERSISLAANGYVSFKGFVDSQNSDRLELLVDGAVTSAVSGAYQVGEWAAPLSSGTHNIRIQYSKDSMVDEGLDTAWVDDVRIYSNNQLIETSSFTEAVDCSIPGWTRGGFGGGWCVSTGPERREIRRPRAMAFAGYQPAPRSIGLQRSMEWPATAGNELVATYFVDSEEGKDLLRILIDGSAKFEMSGQMRTGTVRIPVSAGTHQVQIEYSKDESLDVGLDEARVLSLEVRSGGRNIQLGGFDGLEQGTAVPGWAPTGSSGASYWTIVRPRPPVVITAPDTVSRTVDGTLARAEYSASASFQLQDTTESVGAKGQSLASKLKFVSSQDGHVGVGVELPDDLGAWFRAGGMLTLLVDSAELAGNVVPSCVAAGGAMPGPSARKFEVAWNSMGQQTIVQSVGQCSTTTPWQLAADSEKWVFAAARWLDTDTDGVTLEMDLVPLRPTGAVANSPIAMMLRVEAGVPGLGSAAFLSLPWRAIPAPNQSDPSTWEEIWLGSTSIQAEPETGRQVDAWWK